MAQQQPLFAPDERPCTKCGSTERGPMRPSGKRGRCLGCARSISKAWYERNKGTETIKRWRRTPAAIESKRMRARQFVYGLTIDQQRAMLDAQHGECACCGDAFESPRRTHLDHDHVTNRARAFVCHFCNVAAGMVKDSSDRAQKLADYLRRYGK